MDQSKRLLIWGRGGHAKVVADLARTCGYQVIGYVDANIGEFDAKAPTLYSETAFLATIAASAANIAECVALGIGDNQRRWWCREELGELVAPTLVHPRATISQSAYLGNGTVVFAGAVVNADAHIGEAAIINTSAVIEHDCVLGNAVHISPAAVLTGGVQVGSGTWIGAGAVILPGVIVGSGVVVGAGAVVVRDVPSGRKVAGVPARPLGRNEV